MVKQGAWEKLILAPMIMAIILNGLMLPIEASKPNEFSATKFYELYDKDLEFKDAVEKIRSIAAAKDSFIDKDWMLIQTSFNHILQKMGLVTLDKFDEKQLLEFKKEIEYMASNIKLIELEKNYIETPSLLMTPQQEIAYATTYAPIVKQPQFDTVGNGLTNVFVDVFEQGIYGYSMPGYNIIEISLVWNDEDYPNNPPLDAAYDAVRQVLYGRLQDIETYFIVIDRTSGFFYHLSFRKIAAYRPGLIDFDGCYSSTQTWTQSNHYEALKDRYLWDKTSEHAWMYVNTWNHMLGEDQNNAGTHRSYQTWTEFTLQHGNRITTENTIQWLYDYTNEALYQAP